MAEKGQITAKLNDQSAQWVEAQMETGQFTNYTDYFLTLIREDKKLRDTRDQFVKQGAVEPLEANCSYGPEEATRPFGVSIPKALHAWMYDTVVDVVCPSAANYIRHLVEKDMNSRPTSE